jgi:hypothetical protein
MLDVFDALPHGVLPIHVFGAEVILSATTPSEPLLLRPPAKPNEDKERRRKLRAKDARRKESPEHFARKRHRDRASKPGMPRF